MQDDLSDAVKWAIDQGIADPGRVCIAGASYGGYAALAGVTFTPELYCCAVNYVGVSDLAIATSPGRFGGNLNDFFIRTWIGNDHDTLYNRSPVNFVERIRVPTLHAYGENDPRVVMKNWTELEAELKRFNKPYEALREENEGHGFHHEGARITFYRQMEAFLAHHLAPSK
jgi:dipeptidyl aminopeptidase/acylaminoacyl peptidase